MVQRVVRLATQDDIDRVLELGFRFLEEGPYKDHLGKNEDVSRRLTELLIQNQNSRVVVGEVDDKVVGVFALVLYNHYFSGEPTAGEIVWYVEPEHRGTGLALELLWFAESLAYQAGARKMQLTAPTHQVGELYTKLNYTPIETAFQSELGSRVRH